MLTVNDSHEWRFMILRINIWGSTVDSWGLHMGVQELGNPFWTQPVCLGTTGGFEHSSIVGVAIVAMADWVDALVVFHRWMVPEATRLGNLKLLETVTIKHLVIANDLTRNIWVRLREQPWGFQPCQNRKAGTQPVAVQWWRTAYCSGGIPNVGKTNHQFLDE